MIKVIVSAALVSAFVILAPSAMAQASNFTSYTGDLTNSTAMIVWTGKYCNLKFNSIEPAKSAYIAKDGDPKHTAECNKFYNTAIEIISNAINSDAEKIDKQGKNCAKVSSTIDEMRTCMGLS
jgi:hypothetical protein